MVLLEYNISGIKFNINISDEYYNDINRYLDFNVGGSDQFEITSYKTEIFYYVDNKQLEDMIDRLENQVSENIEYFRDSISNMYYLDSKIYIVSNHNDWIIEEEEGRLSVYVRNDTEMYMIQLARILKSIIQGVFEDRGMILMHGAAVSYKDYGFIIMGSKGSGKTTLLSYFLQCKADILANDRVFLDNKLRMISYPQALRVAEGSFQIVSEYNKYYLQKEFYRTQDDKCNPNFKYLITLKEIEDIFHIHYISNKTLDYVLIPNIQIGKKGIKINTISKEEKKKIFEYVCFTPIDESFRYRWVYQPEKNIYDKIKSRNEIKSILISDKVFISVEYGTENTYQEVIQQIRLFIEQIH